MIIKKKNNNKINKNIIIIIIVKGRQRQTSLVSQEIWTIGNFYAAAIFPRKFAAARQYSGNIS